MPSANGFGEKFMCSPTKALQAARTEHKTWRLELVSFLRAYIVTSYSSTAKSQTELIFYRTHRTKPSEMTTCGRLNADSDIRQRDARAKSKMKAYADTRHRATPHDVHIGDFVLVRQQKKNKLSSFYDIRPYTITDINHSVITATRQPYCYMKLILFLRNYMNIQKKIRKSIKQREMKELTMTSP